MNSERSRRPVTDADADFLWRLYASTRAAEVAAWGWPADQQNAFLRMQYSARRSSYAAAYPDAEHSILLEDGVAAGATLVARGNGEILLMDIAFLPEFRGCGYGADVMRQLVREAGSTGLRLRLTVERGNPAIHLYMRHGFIPKSQDAMYIEMEFQPAEFNAG